MGLALAIVGLGWLGAVWIYQLQAPVLTVGQISLFLAVLIWMGHSVTQQIVRQRLLSTIPIATVWSLVLFGLISGITPPDPIPSALAGLKAAFHISLSLGGVAMLLGSGVFGAGQLILHKQLRQHTYGNWFQHLPSMDELDKLRRMTMYAGWWIVTLSLVFATIMFFLNPARLQPMISHLHPMVTLWVLISFSALADLRRWMGVRRRAFGSLLLSLLMTILLAVSVIEFYRGSFL